MKKTAISRILVMTALTFVVCARENAVSVNKNDRETETADGTIEGKWFLASSVRLSEEGTRDTATFSFDESTFMLEVRESVVVVYARAEYDPFRNQTFCDTVGYSMTDTGVITDGVWGTMPITLSGERMTVVTDSEGVIECVYRRHSQPFPPSEWPPIDNNGLSQLTAFYPQLVTSSAGSVDADYVTGYSWFLP